MRYYEFAENIIKPKKPLTPDQARIEAMKNQVKNTQKLIKSEKARQKIKAGQNELIKIF
jgi:endo-1,4-beta-D-glucanase Y